MNTWLTWRPDERFAERITQGLRAVLRRGTRLSHHLFSVVGGMAVLFALALWLMPSWRGTFAARVMPFVSAAVQAGPARLLQGNPLPSFAPPGAHSGVSDDSLASTASNSAAVAGGVAPVSMSGVAGDSNSAAATSSPFASVTLNGLDPRSLPSVGELARMIPSQRVAADARDNRVLVSVREQALVATYLSRRYRVAQEPVGELVKAAFDTGREVGLDPLLLLAVMAIESGFNPYAESGVGAQGLMQVMSKVHSDKFQYFGGKSAALDPLANIKVGALVLKDCIARGGSLAGGLRLYVGSSTQDDGGYGAKVIAERSRLRDVARGVKVPINAPQAPTTAAAPAQQSQTTVASAKRVQVTLDGAHPLSDKAAAATAHVPAQDDASTSAQKHPSPEMGA
ncbi:transglycosylase SLT domain-containing protein [Paraburkholderia sp. SUR17]|uniref:transglycosylase SLT domain-containing protein n=1 Tax=Paraburkholderia sp. SUR17 TaxID=3034358 RepID=UPI0024085BDF|nr:transglycosylase SLT domain-containing protein [Paraburkholderia sp. SUR17]WEY38069.1 transglycosylase SLT domain-containing protein [Paraburkholderia sp. SUR17]